MKRVQMKQLMPGMVALLLFASACASLPAQGGVASSTPPLPIDQAPELPTQPAQPPTLPSGEPGEEIKNPEGIPEEAVLVFRLSGGIAGLNEEWTIYADGRLTSVDGRSWQIEPREVEQLLDRLLELGFFELAVKAGPQNACCDLFFYDLYARIDGQARMLSTVDGAPGVPDPLWQAIHLVQEFIQAKAK